MHNELADRNLTDIVDVIFVSDHGMTGVYPQMIYLDDIIGADGIAAIEHSDGWPSRGLRFSSAANESHYLRILLKSASENQEKFDVYTHDTMPERYHYANSERIAPVYAVPKLGYAFTTEKEADTGFSTGVSSLIFLRKRS